MSGSQYVAAARCGKRCGRAWKASPNKLLNSSSVKDKYPSLSYSSSANAAARNLDRARAESLERTISSSLRTLGSTQLFWMQCLMN